MEDIENIIKRYQQELLEFSSKTPQFQQEEPSPERNVIIEDPQPVAEEIPSVTFDGYLTYEDFLRKNTETGTLRVQVFAGERTFPIPGAKVEVYLPLIEEESIRLFNGITDVNGIIDNISLPAPPSELSQSPETAQSRPFSFYTVAVEHPRYAGSQFLNVPVFSNVKSIQDVQLIPLVSSGESPQPTTRIQTEPFLQLRGDENIGNSDST